MTDVAARHREHGEDAINFDAKSARSRRTLKLPQIVLRALRERKAAQAAGRLRAGELWQDSGLVFTTTAGTGLDQHNVRRQFRQVTGAAGLGGDWVPRELRHTFVSIMPADGVPVEEIARVVGHKQASTTEVVYRRELRPVITTGAEVMDRVFGWGQGSLTGGTAGLRARRAGRCGVCRWAGSERGSCPRCAGRFVAGPHTLIQLVSLTHFVS